MKRVFGCAAFGLRDCIWQPEEGCTRKDFYLADVVLPQTHFGRMLTGREAKEERIHTGLYWPPEARVQAGEFLRRVPVPYAWRALVEAGDRMVRWKVGDGVSFPLSHIISCHIKDILEKQMTNFSKDQDSIVVAIPDNLDEYGQELLIKELYKKLCLRKKEEKEQEQVILIWRPIAAALAWLDKVEGDFIPSRMGPNDHIHVIYLGPDAFEFTTFRLRERKDKKGLKYIVPVRERPTSLPNLSGMDWAGRVIEETFDWPDEGEFWQVFTRFPEVWAAIADLSWSKKEFPRAWSIGNGWAFWDPPHDLYKRALCVPAGPCLTLKEICRDSCPVRLQRNSKVKESINEFLKKEVRKLFKKYQGGRLYGMILCGPLMPNGIPPWLETELETLAARGLRLDDPLDEPELGRLWISPHSEEAVAEGAAIYGKRLIKGIPTYLDTMPQLSILAQHLGRYKWIPLVEEKEVAGGQTYENRIERRFQLTQGSRKLNVYLLKGWSGNSSSISEDPDDFTVVRSNELSPCDARLVREVVKRCGSLENVKRLAFFRSESAASKYGLAFAKAFYSTGKEEHESESHESQIESMNQPFRKAVFHFPSSPERNMPLDIVVRMKPASGLAQIEIKPEDPTFLRGRQVFLDYSTMKGASRLPSQQRGWPPIREIPVDPEDTVLHEWGSVITRFEKAGIHDTAYTMIINQVKEMLTRKTPVHIAGTDIYTHVIDQNGQPCTEYGRECIRRLSSKFGKDFIGLVEKNRMNDTLKQKLLVRATWMYASAPTPIVEYAREVIAQDSGQQIWNWAVEAASRAFTNVEDFQLLFGVIANRALRRDLPRPFPIQSARAVCRVLMFRRNGYLGLNPEMAEIFARKALESLSEQKSKQNYKKLFFQLILLLFYLLRYRKAEPRCFDPHKKESIVIFEEAIKYMKDAEGHLHKKGEFQNASRVKEVVKGFSRYIYYEGGEDVVTIIGDLAGDLF